VVIVVLITAATDRVTLRAGARLQRAGLDALPPVAFPPSRLGAKNKSNRQDELACGSELGVSWLGRERGEVTNRCRCSSRPRRRAVGYLALWVGVAGYLASLHGVVLTLAYASMVILTCQLVIFPLLGFAGYLTWRARLYSLRDGIQLAVRFHVATVIGGYSNRRTPHVGAARDGLSHVGFLRAISHGLDSPTWFIIERAEI